MMHDFCDVTVLINLQYGITIAHSFITGRKKTASTY